MIMKQLRCRRRRWGVLVGETNEEEEVEVEEENQENDDVGYKYK